MGCMACTEPLCLYSTAIPLLLLWVFEACSRVKFAFTFCSGPSPLARLCSGKTAMCEFKALWVNVVRETEDIRSIPKPHQISDSALRLDNPTTVPVQHRTTDWQPYLCLIFPPYIQCTPHLFEEWVTTTYARNWRFSSTLRFPLSNVSSIPSNPLTFRRLMSTIVVVPHR